MSEAPTLFDLHNPEPSEGQQPPWVAERDLILEAVASKVDTVVPEFRARAEAFVLAHLETHGPTSGEELTRQCRDAGLVPHDDRAFGPVYMALSRRGQIVKVGYAPRERGHGTAGGHIWARGGNGK